MALNDKIQVRAILRWSWAAIRGSRLRVLAICILGLLRVAASLSFIWVSKMLIDAAVSPDTPMARIWQLSILLAILLLTESGMVQASSYTARITMARIQCDLRHKIYSILLKGSATDERHTGDSLNRITVDVTNVVTYIVETLPSILVMSTQLIAAFWLLFKMSPTLALCALVITPICILASKAYLLKMRAVNTDIRNNESSIHTNLQEGLQHRTVVQTLECAPMMSSRLGSLQKTLMGNVVKQSRITLYSRMMVRLGFIGGYLIAFVWSVFQLHAGAITYGIMTAFLQLVGRIQSPISSMSSTLPKLISASTSVERLMELCPAAQLRQAASPAACTVVSDFNSDKVGVKLVDVSFRYNAEQPLVLSAFSCDFRPGSKTVIMGQTGVGKSTLTKLVLALLQPQEGKVVVYDDDGVEVEAGEATRRFMTYVPQGNSLLNGTIRENLQLGDPNATDADMAQALDIAVANFVYDLPSGLDTEVGELGTRLSEGQCQRIAIARALLRHVPIMILDEFNSSLDASTAAALMQRLQQARPGATIIFISHRREVADYCDNILNLEAEK